MLLNQFPIKNPRIKLSDLINLILNKGLNFQILYYLKRPLQGIKKEAPLEMATFDSQKTDRFYLFSE